VKAVKKWDLKKMSAILDEKLVSVDHRFEVRIGSEEGGGVRGYMGGVLYLYAALLSKSTCWKTAVQLAVVV